MNRGIIKCRGSIRLEVVVDLVRRNGSQRVFDVERSVLGPLLFPNGVQTFPTDAASQVCVQLSRGALVLRTVAQLSGRLALSLRFWAGGGQNVYRRTLQQRP